MDENCVRFLTKVLPEVYRKLLDSQPVTRWNNEIQTGVFHMTTMGVDLIALRLEQLLPLKIVPELLLEVLSLVCPNLTIIGHIDLIYNIYLF